MLFIVRHSSVEGRRVPVRPFAVAESLEELRGPVGIVTLPLTADWSPRQSFDLSDDATAISVYSQILGRTPDPAIMAAYVNGRRLAEVWGRIRLPQHVRFAWEQSIPALTVEPAVA